MKQLILATLALVCSASLASAAYSPAKKTSALNRSPSPEVRQGSLVKEAAKEEGNDLVINDDTDVQLDGKKCKYNKVPANAEIILLELGANKKTILKIHFQTKK